MKIAFGSIPEAPARLREEALRSDDDDLAKVVGGGCGGNLVDSPAPIPILCPGLPPYGVYGDRAASRTIRPV